MVRITGAGHSPIVIMRRLYRDLNGTTSTNESDAVVVPPGQSGTAYLSWDQWPQSLAPVTRVAGPAAKCDPSGCQTRLVLDLPVRSETRVPGRPAIRIASGAVAQLLPNNNDLGTTSNGPLAQVKQGSGTPAVRHDPTYRRDVGPSLLSVSNSVERPPGAARFIFRPRRRTHWQWAPPTSRTTCLEPYSSQGPTIDRRVVAGHHWLRDNVSTSLDQFRSFSPERRPEPRTLAVGGSVDQVGPTRTSTLPVRRRNSRTGRRGFLPRAPRRPISWVRRAVGARFPSASHSRRPATAT